MKFNYFLDFSEKVPLHFRPKTRKKGHSLHFHRGSTSKTSGKVLTISIRCFIASAKLICRRSGWGGWSGAREVQASSLLPAALP